MKKVILLVVLALLTFTACQKEDVYIESEDYIVFDGISYNKLGKIETGSVEFWRLVNDSKKYFSENRDIEKVYTDPGFPDDATNVQLRGQVVEPLFCSARFVFTYDTPNSTYNVMVRVDNIATQGGCSSGMTYYPGGEGHDDLFHALCVWVNCNGVNQL